MKLNNKETSFCSHQKTDFSFYTPTFEIDDNESNMRSSDDSIKQSTTYLSFEELNEIQIEQNMNRFFENLSEELGSTDWIVQFHAIDKLRSLNKYFPQDTNYLFIAFRAQISSLLNVKRPFIVKNLLLFFLEVIRMFKPGFLEKDLLIKLTEILIKKTNSTSKLIRSVAEEGLKEISTRCICDEVLQAMCLMAQARHKLYSERAFYFVVFSLDMIKERIAEFQPQTLKEVFRAISYTLESQSSKNKEFAKSILKYLNQLMGTSNFQCYLEFLVNAQEISSTSAYSMLNAINEKSVCRPSLANELNQRKSIVPGTQIEHQTYFVEINKEIYEFSNFNN